MQTQRFRAEADRRLVRQTTPEPRGCRCRDLPYAGHSAPASLATPLIRAKASDNVDAMFTRSVVELCVAVALIGGVNCTEENPYLNVCGNNVLEAEVGEECDHGMDGNR